MEEAQAIAAEFIQSLDNLPAEVQHHLAEIRDRENRIADIQARIQSKMNAYLYNMTRDTLTPKDIVLHEKVTQEQERIRELSEEKVMCAERVVHLLTKAMGRLDVDLSRAMDRTGDAAPQEALTGSTGGSRTPIERLSETLRSTLAHGEGNASIVLPPAGQNGASGASTPHPPNKRRRLNSATPSPAPGADATAPHVAAGRSRLSVVHMRPVSPAPRSRRATSELVKDGDGEGDGDGEDDPDDPSGDPEDKTLYCTCQSMSYGKMIGCENDSCPYQWFHLSCVGLQDPLPKHWFCPTCVEKHGAALTGGERRRRRK